jgi:hypothetical protein
MSDAQRVTEIAVLTESTGPRAAIVQIHTADAELKLEITEDLAQKLCADLERFLTR